MVSKIQLVGPLAVAEAGVVELPLELLLPPLWTWIAPLGTVTNWAVAILPSEVLTCTVVPPSAVKLYGTDPGIR